MDKVFVVVRVDKNNDKVIWKVYKSENIAKIFCKTMSDDDYKYRYEDWIVK